MQQIGPKLTEEDIEVLKKVLHDWGCYEEYHKATYKEVEALKDKFNVKD